jgi:hypothetical protein
MRTLMRFEPDGHAVQVVHASGIAEIEVYDAGEHDPARLAAEIDKLYATKVFDYEHEWPMRWALVRSDGRFTHAVAAISHHVADGVAAMAMFEDFHLRDPDTGAPPRPPGIQPLAQAAVQRETAARRQNDASLRYWEEQLRVIAPTMFPAAPLDVAGGRFLQADFTSPALLAALRAAAMKFGVSTGAVLYTAFASALSPTTGVNPVATTVTVNNRFRPGLGNAAGPMAQLGLCTLDVAGAGFGELVVKARRRLLTAQKYAYYAPYENDSLVRRVGRERGVTFDLRCMFNDRRSPDGPLETVTGLDEIRAALASTTIAWHEVDNLHQRLMVHVNEHPQALVAEVQADTAYLGRGDVEAMLRRMEEIVLDSL